MVLQHNALLQHILERFLLRCDTSTIFLNKMLRWKKSKTSGLWILVIALSREGSGRHGDEIRSGAVLLYLLLNKNVESFDTSILLSIFDDIKKSVFRNCSSTGMVVFIEQRETLWIIVGLTCGFDNLFTLTPLFFMVQPYVFELLIATLLSYVVPLLTCRSSVKRISRNRILNGVLWVTFRLPPGVDTEQN